MMTDSNTTSDQVAVLNAEQSELVDGASPKRTSTSYAHDKAKILARLRRMEGQVRGVQRMVEGDEYCLDVLTQLSAIIAAARQTGLLVLEDHVRGCVAGAWQEGASDEHREEMMTELMGAIDRFGRSVG
jgi:DNA-binding FrmR family transcriptional regulator